MSLLHSAGADVPRPYTRSDSAILMEYVGDADGPAPMLHRVSLDPEEARPLFDRLIRNVELWLSCGRIHADLSPFNILYWQGGLKVIDFPQAVDPASNPQALSLLERDLENVCRYWARHGVRVDANRLARRLWAEFRYGGSPEAEAW